LTAGQDYDAAMASFEAIRLDDVPRGYDRGPGVAELKPVRHQLGISAFGVSGRIAHEAGQALVLPHDEREGGPSGTDGHEELYVVMRGHAVFTIDGADVDAPAGTLVFVRDPAVVRSAVAREEGTAIIGVGAPPGRAFRPAPWEARAVDADAKV
jgi:mannose-6-phosphate isomerase-like protein (cupin superfamily)